MVIKSKNVRAQRRAQKRERKEGVACAARRQALVGEKERGKKRLIARPHGLIRPPDFEEARPMSAFSAMDEPVYTIEQILDNTFGEGARTTPPPTVTVPDDGAPTNYGDNVGLKAMAEFSAGLMDADPDRNNPDPHMTVGALVMFTVSYHGLTTIFPRFVNLFRLQYKDHGFSTLTPRCDCN